MNKQLLKPSGADVLSSRRKLRKTLWVGSIHPTPTTPNSRKLRANYKKEITTPFEEMSLQELNKCLSKFYFSERKIDGRGRSVITRQNCNRELNEVKIIIFVRNYLTVLVYSYFEKGCRKKYTRQSQKVLWVVLRALFFKEIWKSGTGGGGGVDGHMFTSAKGKKQTKWDRQLQSLGTVVISHITFRDRLVHIPPTFLEGPVY